MRRFVLIALALMLFALPANALASNQNITLSVGGFDKTAVAIKTNESVTFTNNTLLDTVQFDDESSSRCASSGNADCTRTFAASGKYRFFDPQHLGCTSYAACADPYRGVVAVYDAPSASVTPSSVTINRGQSVQFNAAADTNPSGGALTYEWDLDGDGTFETTGAGPSATVAFPNAGTFNVAVRVTDEAGNQATSTASVVVNVPDSDGDGVNDDADRCPNDPAATPDGCPVVAPLVPAPLATSAVAPPDLGVAGALKSGVSTVLSCSDTCTGVFTLTRSGKAVGIPVTAKLNGPGSTLVTIKFTRAARRALAKVKNPRLLMQVVVTDALGRTQTRKRSVVLRAVKTYGKLPAIGISDNQPTTFSDPNFEVLKLRYARLVEPWNGIFTEPDRLDAWLQAARAHHIRPLISFEHSRGMVCPGRKCKGPSGAQYAKAWRAFHHKYPWVKDISPWNEVNSATQPTGRHPEQAATYYNIVRASCRGCTIVAADLLDSSNIRRYASTFLRRAHGKPRLWGLHNYTDTNRFRSRGTKALLASVPGTVWLTETGGVVRFVTQSGKVALPKSESRAKKAMDYMFRLAEQNANRIKRIYVYQWKINNVFDRFDAGVVRPDGTPRPSYDVLTLNASIAAKR